jgi:pyridoxine 5'-phosphate synthase PdxJ
VLLSTQLKYQLGLDLRFLLDFLVEFLKHQRNLLLLTVLFQDRPLNDALDQLVKMGVQAVEIGTGSYPGNAHCNPSELLKSSQAIKDFKKKEQNTSGNN